MFGNELLIGSIRAQRDRLKSILHEIEDDAHWRERGLYYARELREIEKGLRRIRKADFEPIYS